VLSQQNLALLQPAPDREFEISYVARLYQVVIDSLPERGNCRIHRRISRQDYPWSQRPALAELVQHRHAVNAFHVQIDNHQVVMVASYQSQGFPAAVGAVAPVTFPLEHFAEGNGDTGLIIDNEDQRLFGNFFHSSLLEFLDQVRPKHIITACDFSSAYA